VVVANGPYFGGGMKIAPAADPTDGRLDVVVLGALGRFELVRWLPSVYWGGHLANPKVSVRAARSVSLGWTERPPAHADGEPLPEAPVRLRVQPRGLRLRR
jgi:diacylglycerol kinase family enzyme